MHPVLALQPASAKLGGTHPTPPEPPILSVLKDFRDRELSCYGVLHLSTTKHSCQPGWGQALRTSPPHVSHASFKVYHNQPFHHFTKLHHSSSKFSP